MFSKKILTALLVVSITAAAACTAWAEPVSGSDTDAALVETAPAHAESESDSSTQTDASLSETTAAASASGMTLLEQLRNAGPGVSGSSGSSSSGSTSSKGLTYQSGDTVVYGGVTYKKGAYQGTHKMSGYTWSEEYGNMTASGKGATSNHTVAYSSSLPLGTQIIVEYSSGPLDHRYDAVYTIEDRGDYHIENEGWIDIFFDTYAQACAITDLGWNYADVWVALPQ